MEEDMAIEKYFFGFGVNEEKTFNVTPSQA